MTCAPCPVEYEAPHACSPRRGSEGFHRSALLQGDPSAAPYAVENAKAILGQKPVFGICMGHQVLGQAFGGTTFKLPFGHHGGNHPIRDVDTGKVQISAQNHNFAVDTATLPEGVKVSHINLNDGASPTAVAASASVLRVFWFWRECL